MAMTGAVEKLDRNLRAAKLENGTEPPSSSFHPFHVLWLGSSVGHHSLPLADNIREKANVKRWLSASDPYMKFDSARKDRQAGTGRWFTESKEFVEWLITPGLLYWLHGIRKLEYHLTFGRKVI